jgi:DNA-binding MarR family transcriptional regulator
MSSTEDRSDDYNLDSQIGYLLRRAHQRHVSIFAERMLEGLTPQQFTVLVRLKQMGKISQNELGRQAAMDQATINGVVQRLSKRGYIKKSPSPTDKRMVLLEPTKDALAAMHDMIPVGRDITNATLAPLSAEEADMLQFLLKKIAEPTT